MKIRLRLGDVTLEASLLDTDSARDFASLLPLSLTLNDFAGTEKIAYLPRKLTTTDATDGVDPDVGDITYYAPWGNLAIFYKDSSYANGLVKLGTIDSGIESLATISDGVTVAIEAED